MKEAEFKLIRRSFIYRLTFSVISTLLLILASHLNLIFFGMIITGLISFPFFFIISVKFFPDSSDFFSFKYKNFSWKRKDLDIVPEDYEIKSDYFDDYRRG